MKVKNGLQKFLCHHKDKLVFRGWATSRKGGREYALFYGPYYRCVKCGRQNFKHMEFIERVFNLNDFKSMEDKCLKKAL